jgi:hypothetical protein
MGGQKITIGSGMGIYREGAGLRIIFIPGAMNLSMPGSQQLGREISIL